MAEQGNYESSLVICRVYVQILWRLLCQRLRLDDWRRSALAAGIWLHSYRSPISDYDHRSILGDPKWREITEKGRTSVQFLRALIIDPTEQDIFSDKPYACALTAGDFSWPLRPP